MITARDIVTKLKLPDWVTDALRYARHPQERTRAFHRFYDAPVHGHLPDAAFSHMDNQRVAFRASFIMSEAIELLEKGLGMTVSIVVSASPESQQYVAHGSDNGHLTTAFLGAMNDGGLRNVVEVVDALGDLNVVVNGFALELGVDMFAVDQEICASNFTKADEDGRPIVADGSDPKFPKGKVLKGPHFFEPNIAGILGLEK